MSAKANINHELEVELELHELGAVRHLRYLDHIMTDVLDSARPSGTDGFVVLAGGRFAFEHLVGELAHAVNHSHRWSAGVEALNSAADAIELALADH
ncbi:MAG: hypothetical protein ABI895_41245 [Deltaproteobacteria bacterium]